MIKINLVAVGKVKEKYFQDAIIEYAKRLKRFCEFNLIEVQEENFQKVDEGTAQIIKQREAERIKPHLRGHVICLAIEGKKLSSEQFSKTIDKISLESGVITFVIGGSYGIDDTIKKNSNALISFSDMTFPHTLFRVMFVEQIYRAFMINGGSAYHK